MLRQEFVVRRPMPRRHTPSPLGVRLQASKPPSLYDGRSTDSGEFAYQTRTPSLTSVIGTYQSLSSSTTSQADPSLRVSPYYDYSENFEFNDQAISPACSPEQTLPRSATPFPSRESRSTHQRHPSSRLGSSNSAVREEKEPRGASGDHPNIKLPRPISYGDAAENNYRTRPYNAPPRVQLTWTGCPTARPSGYPLAGHSPRGCLDSDPSIQLAYTLSRLGTEETKAAIGLEVPTQLLGAFGAGSASKSPERLVQIRNQSRGSIKSQQATVVPAAEEHDGTGAMSEVGRSSECCPDNLSLTERPPPAVCSRSMSSSSKDTTASGGQPVTNQPIRITERLHILEDTPPVNVFISPVPATVCGEDASESEQHDCLRLQERHQVTADIRGAATEDRVSSLPVISASRELDSSIIAPEPISPVRELKLRNSVPRLMKALLPLAQDSTGSLTAASDDSALNFSPNFAAFRLPNLSTPPRHSEDASHEAGDSQFGSDSTSNFDEPGQNPSLPKLRLRAKAPNSSRRAQGPPGPRFIGDLSPRCRIPNLEMGPSLHGRARGRYKLMAGRSMNFGRDFAGDQGTVRRNLVIEAQPNTTGLSTGLCKDLFTPRISLEAVSKELIAQDGGSGNGVLAGTVTMGTQFNNESCPQFGSRVQSGIHEIDLSIPKLTDGIGEGECFPCEDIHVERASRTDRSPEPVLLKVLDRAPCKRIIDRLRSELDAATSPRTSPPNSVGALGQTTRPKRPTRTWSVPKGRFRAQMSSWAKGVRRAVRARVCKDGQ